MTNKVKIGNPLKISYLLRELADEYGLKDYTICLHRIDGMYTAVMRWYHKGMDSITNLAIAATEKTISIPEWSDDSLQCQKILKMKQQRCRQAMVDLIMEHGAVQ